MGRTYRVKVVVDVDVDSDLGFPADEKGALIWDPFQYIEDYISHGLFKEHDASYMTTLGDGLDFVGWRVKFSEKLTRKLAKIMAENLWNHPEDERGKKLHNEYSTLDEAIKAVTEEAIKAFCNIGGKVSGSHK